ncbi:DUF4199 domain-containing protein [Algoriphagus sp. AGSA1]|uniref:DUF4199 domain-containing protein n=1 Tax=Algoriphagus sp. AGSA1 TaxID=2907213 RepID=UPI001F1E6D6C|nr:DUF4199 domain-containing protein [Algoriphagus sp. AGSA1]MCE7054097.1 DUF4199 domain-containing protein [Algoriphagus sp. AGSA1]
MKNIKIEIKWALVFVLMMLVWVAIEKSVGWHDEKIADHATLTNLVAIPAVAIYLFALIDKKKNYYKGVMGYYQGFLAGLVITLIVAALSPVTQYITSTFITPDYFHNVIEYAVDTGEMTREEAESYFNLRSYIIMSAAGALVMGIATSAVVAALVKSRSKTSAITSP